MFVDFENQPVPPPWRPAPTAKQPSLTPRQQRILAVIIGLNLALLIVAPIGGATLLEIFELLFR